MWTNKNELLLSHVSALLIILAGTWTRVNDICSFHFLTALLDHSRCPYLAALQNSFWFGVPLVPQGTTGWLSLQSDRQSHNRQVRFTDILLPLRVHSCSASNPFFVKYNVLSGRFLGSWACAMLCFFYRDSRVVMSLSTSWCCQGEHINIRAFLCVLMKNFTPNKIEEWCSWIGGHSKITRQITLLWMHFVSLHFFWGL